MKKSKYLSYTIAAVVAAAVATGCNKLDEYNPGGTSPESVFTTPAGFVTVVNGAYREIHEWYGIEDGALLTEGGTDLWYNAGRSNYTNGITRYEGLTPSAVSTVTNAWKSAWAGIDLCNEGISHIDGAGFTDSTEKAKRLSELKFLRALYYYHVVEQFGGVMLRTTPTTTVDLTATRSTPEQFYDLMISDLLYAKDHLPLSWGNSVNSEYNRASKKSAMGLLARVYLTRAYYSTGADAQAWFTKARDAALDVINNKTTLGTDLWSSYAQLFNPSNNKLNKESLFTVTYSQANATYNYNGAGNGNRLYKWYVMKYSDKPGLQLDTAYGYDNEQRLMPTWHLLDLYNETIDGRYAASFQEVWLANKSYTWAKTDTGAKGAWYKDPSVFGKTINIGDTAMYITKGTLDNKASRKYLAYDRNDTYVGAVPGSPALIDPLADTKSNFKFFVSCKKFFDNSRTKTTDAGYNDIFVIRLAEMYMIAAEADFQLGDNVNAAAMINVLRTRAAKSSATVAAMQIQPSDVTLQFILDERAREFAGEIQRWYDLKRVFRGSDFADYIKKYNPDITAVQGYHRLRPIPQAEVNALLNFDEFKQNDGY